MSIDATAAKRELKSTAPADEELCRSVAQQLNAALFDLYPEAKSQGQVYFQLFRRMDPLRRNIVRYPEWLEMVRIGLGCSKAHVNDVQLRAFWRAADADAKGVVALGAFVRLMGKGWKGFTDERERQRLRPDWGLSQYALAGPAWEDPLSPSLTDRAAQREDDRCDGWAAWREEQSSKGVARRSVSFSRAKPRRGRRRAPRRSDTSEEETAVE